MSKTGQGNWHMDSNNTTENFWEVWNNFQWPEPNPVTYRCYYHEDGTVDFYTMDDLPGRYIEVSREIYVASPHNAKIQNGVFHLIPKGRSIESLVPGQPQGTRCHPRDVCIVVLDHETGINWDIKQHEID